MRRLSTVLGVYPLPILALLVCLATAQGVSPSFENKTGSVDNGKPRIFSPRMDYDEWTPLGRGDPLKNNPTYDYVPPVLDRVQYWLDSHTTEPSAKRDILVLGVTAKKTSSKIPEQFLKFVDGPKFTRANQDGVYKTDFTGSSGAEPPKVIRTTSFRNGVVDYRNQNRIVSAPTSYYPSPYYSQKSKPYAMMLPPPVAQKPTIDVSSSFNGITTKDKLIGYGEPSQPFSTQTEEGPILQDSQFYSPPLKSYNQFHLSHLPPRQQQVQVTARPPPKGVVLSQVETIKSIYTPSSQPAKTQYDGTTSPSVSFEKSNLIYQSTQTLSGSWLGSGDSTVSSSAPESSQAPWHVADHFQDPYEVDHQGSASSHHEVIVGQNANIIVDSESDENGEVVVGQKQPSASESTTLPSTNVPEPSPSTTPTVKEVEEKKEATDEEQPSQKMHIVVANSPSSSELETHTSKKGPVAVVMPTNYVERKNKTTVSPIATPQNATDSSIKIEDSEMPIPQVSKPQVPKKTMMSPPSSGFFDEPIVQPSALPNRMISPIHQQPAPALPSRHPGAPPQMFPMVSQPMMHQRVQSMMQQRPINRLMGSGRPSMGFRPPAPLLMSHISPPMSHIHGPPPKVMLGPHTGTVMEEVNHRPPQVPSFSMSFGNPSTLSFQPSTSSNDQSFDRQPSLVPETTALPTNTPPVSTMSFSPSTSPSSEAEIQERMKMEQSALLKILNDEEAAMKRTTTPRFTTTTPSTTTPVGSTTESGFSRYKQPAKPVRGPMYLIIQGHSKVKTYKPTVTKHSVPLDNNEITESSTERQLSKFEQFVKENTKSVKKAEERKEKKPEKKASVVQDSLMSLIESGFSAFTVSPTSTDDVITTVATDEN